MVRAEANKRLKMKIELERFIFLFGRRLDDPRCHSSVVNYRRLDLNGGRL